ncbi:MAG: hypothetical protein NXI14_08930 [bacterium]|nr:hypothetical protein [bacterium]
MPTAKQKQLARKACGVKLTGNFAYDYEREPRIRAMLSEMGRDKHWFIRRCENAELSGRHALLSVVEVALKGGLDDIRLSSDPAVDYEFNPKLKRAAQLAGFKNARSFGLFAKATLARGRNPLHYLETKIEDFGLLKGV